MDAAAALATACCCMTAALHHYPVHTSLAQQLLLLLQAVTRSGATAAGVGRQQTPHQHVVLLWCRQRPQAAAGLAFRRIPAAGGADSCPERAGRGLPAPAGQRASPAGAPAATQPAQGLPAAAAGGALQEPESGCTCCMALLAQCLHTFAGICLRRWHTSLLWAGVQSSGH